MFINYAYIANESWRAALLDQGSKCTLDQACYNSLATLYIQDGNTRGPHISHIKDIGVVESRQHLANKINDDSNEEWLLHTLWFGST